MPEEIGHQQLMTANNGGIHVTHNNDRKHYTIAIDIAKEGTELWDLTPYIKGRVGDNLFGLQIVWYYQGRLMNLDGLRPYIQGNVGQYSIDDDKQIQLDPKPGVVSYTGDPKDCDAGGRATYYFPEQMFLKDGIFKGYIGLIDDKTQSHVSGVTIWFKVLPGLAQMGHACDFYISDLENAILKAQQKMRAEDDEYQKQLNDNAKQFSDTLTKAQADYEKATSDALQELRDKYKQEVQKNEDMSAQTRVDLEKLATAVGVIQAHIDAGDVVTKVEYDANKRETDATVKGNTASLKAQQAQLNQLTASPKSDGTTEIVDARVETGNLSARTYPTLGDAMRTQIGGVVQALKTNLTERLILPYSKEDETFYSKTEKLTNKSGALYYYDVAGKSLIHIKTYVEPYINFYTLINSTGNIIDYQRNGDKAASVDVTIPLPAGTKVLILGAKAGTSNSDDAVSVYDRGYEVGSVYQGRLSDETPYIESGPNRLSLRIDASEKDVEVKVDKPYQVWSKADWSDSVTVQHGTDQQFVTIRREDSNVLKTNDILGHFTITTTAPDPEEIVDARTGSADQSSRVYKSLGEAIRDQVGQATRALKNSFEERYAYPYKKEDNTAYNKDSKMSTTSGSIYYFNITGVPLIRIKTRVEAYFNFFTFLDINNQVLDYQRDDKAATVDFVVAPPAGAITLVLGAGPGATNSKNSVTIFDKGYKVGKFYQGSLVDDTYYIEKGPKRASLVIDSENYENLITASEGYEIWDGQSSWVSQLLIPQGSSIDAVMVRKSDGSDIFSTEMYSHFNCQQIPKSELHLKSYRNGLTDISDIFDLSYNNISSDTKDSHYLFYNKDLQTGLRIASQFVAVDHNCSWLIDLDDGYEVFFTAALRDGEGQNIKHDYYNNTNVLKTASNWVGGHVYENLYTQGAYAVIFRKKDGSLIDINTIWDHVRIYEVDNTVHFPDYYRSHMQDRVATINSKLISPDNFGFGFITDVHAEYNTKHFPALIDEVRTKTPVNEFLGGGDWATAWFDAANYTDQKPELFTFFEDLRRLFKGVPLLKTVGNHEWAYGPNNSYNISSQELYGYYLRDEDKMFNDIQWGPDHTYYYWDDKLNHCRFISLNVMDYPSVLKPTNNQDNKEWWFEVSDTQINWLKATLNSVPDGYVVAIESHLVPLNANQFASFPAAKIGTTISNGEDLQAIASAYAAKTGDFANAKGDLIGWFGGHYHADDITVRDGVTYITTLADCMSVWDIPEVPKKTVGTTSEQAFDVATVDRAARKVSLIRVGDGSDRNFTY